MVGTWLRRILDTIDDMIPGMILVLLIIALMLWVDFVITRG